MPYLLHTSRTSYVSSSGMSGTRRPEARQRHQREGGESVLAISQQWRVERLLPTALGWCAALLPPPPLGGFMDVSAAASACTCNSCAILASTLARLLLRCCVVYYCVTSTNNPPTPFRITPAV
eukprot:365431-Chlamydomonas_euryale.AAC.11